MQIMYVSMYFKMLSQTVAVEYVIFEIAHILPSTNMISYININIFTERKLFQII